MMERRTVAAAAALTLSVTAATACGGGSTSGGALEGSGGGGAGSITVITSQAPWNPAYDAVVAAYEESSGVDVDLRAFPNDEVKTQILNDARTGSSTFDVFQVNEVDLAQFNSDGLLLPLTDVDPDYALDEEVFTYDDLPYWDSSTGTFDAAGQLTSVPLLGNLPLLTYRTDVYDALGLQVPTTWDETLANAQAVAEAGDPRYGFVMRTQGVPGTPGITYDFSGILYGVGGSFFREPGVDWTPAFDTPEALEAATLLRDLAGNGPEDSQTVGQAEAIAVMQAGDSAQLSVVAAAASSMNDEANSNIIGDVGYAVLPGGAPPTGTWNLGIPANLPEERREAALAFIDYVTSEEGMEVFVENGGIPTRSDAFDAPGIDESAQEYLDVVRDSAETSAGPFRLTFIGPFLETTEPVLADIASGATSPEEGMATLQQEVTQVVQDAGLPTG